MAKRPSTDPRLAPSGRSVAAVPPEELDLAKRDALLQLRIGRSAHFYAIVVSAFLAIDGVFLLAIHPIPTLSSSDHGPSALGPTFYLLLPLLAGLVLAVVGLLSKWGEFQLWPWEPHFSATVAAVGVNALLAAIYVTRLGGYGPFADLGLYPWFLLLTLVGISLALLAMVMTWTPWATSQWASAVCSVLPIATVALVYFPPAGTADLPIATAIALFLSAFLYQTSGSFLHLLSSGSPASEQSVIVSGQSRIVRLAEEVRLKEEAFRFRESTLVKREADVEAAESGVRRQQAYVAEARRQLDLAEKGHRAKSDELAAKERQLAGHGAELIGRVRQIEDRIKAVELREREVASQVPALAGREQRIAQREGEQAKRDAELLHRQQELDRRASALPETEARLEARRKALDQKTTEILRREGEVAAKQAGGGAGPSLASAPGARGSADLGAREARLQQLKSILDEQNTTLGRKAKDLDGRAKSLEDARGKAAEREASLAVRESALREREADLGERLKAADERRSQYETAATDYQNRLAEVGRLQVESAHKGADLDRGLQSISEREKSTQEREDRVKAAFDEIERRERDVLARERTVNATEAEVSLRRQEIARGGDLPIAGLAAIAAVDAGEGVGIRAVSRGSRARGVRSRPLAAEPAPGEEAAFTDTLAPQSGRRYADRLPTGTPRLDELLLGGFPPRSHVMLVGDAFVGKEVVLYSFVAEGLKRGEPVVLVSAARSKDEVSENVGIVLPQFREYEQMGMVTWVDASGSGGPSAPSTTPTTSLTTTTGPDDRAGILTALVQAAKRIEDEKRGPLRVGFLGLSAVLAHSDDRASFSFLQNVVGILKPRDGLAMYSLEGGTLSEPQLESILSRMDGAIVFRQDKDRTFLSVRGFGDVETRDWVECRATSRALVVGSFALERIR